MAFYPTWQADPSQGWQNQFIQQMPQQTPTAITALNPIEFQPQPAAYAYQSNGYAVQTGLGFEPNYGRTYATPVQRYEFNTNQMVSLNQVSLQGVSFAPGAASVAYAASGAQGGVSPMLGGQSDQMHKLSAAATTTTTSLSGNDMPGYPRVNSVPPRSLNCNGYSGEYVSGNHQQSSTTSTTTSQTTTIPPSTNAHHHQPSSAQQANDPQQQQQHQQSTTQQHHQQSSTQQQQQHHQQQHSSSHNQQSPANSASTSASNQQQQHNQQQHHQQQQVPQSPNHVNNTMVPPGPASATNTNHHNMNATTQSQQSSQQIPVSPTHQHLQHNNSFSNNGSNMQSLSPIHQQQQARFQPQHMTQRPPSANGHMSSIGQQQQQQQQHEWSNWNQHNHQQVANNNTLQPLGTAGDMFNQSDRVNLNTRLKTMILNKHDDGDGGGGGGDDGLQQQSATNNSQTHTGHFLSYSHHLRDLNHSAPAASGDGTTNQHADAAAGGVSGAECLTSGSGGPQQQQQQQHLQQRQQLQHQQQHAQHHQHAAAAAAHHAAIEPIGGGGDSSGWKTSSSSSTTPTIGKSSDFQPFETKKTDMLDFGHNQRDSASDAISDAAGKKSSGGETTKVKTEPEKKKRIRKKPAASAEKSTTSSSSSSTANSGDAKAAASFLPSVNSSRIFSTPNPPTPYSSGYGSDTNQTQLTSPLHQISKPYEATRYDSFASHASKSGSGGGVFDANMKIKLEPSGAYASGATQQQQPHQQQQQQQAASGGVVDGDGSMMDMSQVKMEGYERNYQNFINYADYCQSQNQKNNQQQQHFEYNPNQDYANAMANCNQSAQYGGSGGGNGNGNSGGGASGNGSSGSSGSSSNFTPYQQSNFQNNFNQFATSHSSNATPSAPSQHSIHNMMSDAGNHKSPSSQSASTSASDMKSTLTNYEKEIPVYTYPNPGRMQHLNKPSTHQVSEESANSPMNGYPYGGRTDGERERHHTPKTEAMYGDDDCGSAATPAPTGGAEKSGLGEESTVQPSVDRTEKGAKPEVPDCDCFQSDKNPPEPGSYYTHLGKCCNIARVVLLIGPSRIRGY